MKAAIMVQQNQPLIIDDVGFGDSLTIGQVLVEVKYATICGSQIGYQGTRSISAPPDGT